MRLYLEVISGPYEGKRIAAEVGRTVSVGRTTQADIALEDNFLSGVHFAIECDPKSCRLRDMNSRNGTKLNGHMITEAAPLKDGDQVHAGRTDFVVRIDDPLKTMAPLRLPEPGLPVSRESRSSESRAPSVPQPAVAPPRPATEVDEKPRVTAPQPERPRAAELPRHGNVTHSSASAALPPMIESAPLPTVKSAPLPSPPPPPSPPPRPAEVLPPTAVDSYEAATPEGRLVQILSSQSGNLMALVDATHDSRVLTILQKANEEYQSLYRNDKNAAQAPYLVKLPPRSELLKQMTRQGWGKNWGVFLSCPLSLPELREHLRQSLMVTMPDGMELFSRFYDPRFFRGFLETCTAAEAEKFFGPITSYWMEGERPEILLQFRRGRKGAEKKGHLLSVLG
jgi:pSer/pThr/pTyr-binding forkhead associated (FHA) protein